MVGVFMRLRLGLEMPTCLVWKKGGDDRGWAATCPSFDVCGSITHSRQTTQITTLGNPPPEGQREAAVENAGHGCIPRRRKWGSGLRSDGARIGRAALTNKTPSRAALDDKGHSGLKVQVYNGELRLNDQVAA